jgi:hypothetical protein
MLSLMADHQNAFFPSAMFKSSRKANVVGRRPLPARCAAPTARGFRAFDEIEMGRREDRRTEQEVECPNRMLGARLGDNPFLALC